WCVECEGQARARLDAAIPQLAPGVRRRLRAAITPNRGDRNKPLRKEQPLARQVTHATVSDISLPSMDYRREIAQEIVAAARAGAAARVIARGPTRWPFGPGQAGHRRGRARRGDVRVVILALLAERPSPG